MPIKNYFAHLKNEKLLEGVEEYENLGVPRRAIRVRFDQTEVALDWVLFVDLNKVLPHKRRSLQNLLKGKPVKRGVLIVYQTELERIYGSVVFPTMHRVQPELIAHELVSIQPMAQPQGRQFFEGIRSITANEEGGYLPGGRSEEWRSNWEEIPSEVDE